jgi:hypothetical protein
MRFSMWDRYLVNNETRDLDEAWAPFVLVVCLIFFLFYFTGNRNGPRGTLQLLAITDHWMLLLTMYWDRLDTHKIHADNTGKLSVIIQYIVVMFIGCHQCFISLLLHSVVINLPQKIRATVGIHGPWFMRAVRVW